MTAQKTSPLQKIVSEIWTKPYEVFFFILGFLVLAPVIGVVGKLLLSDPTTPLWGNILIVFLCCLGSVLVFAGLTQPPKPSAKDIFWTWIIFSVIFATIGTFGYYEILFIQWLGS